jgi:hypothetical protein
LEAPDRDNRRKATSPNAGERSILTQFPLFPVKSNNFFSCRLMPQQMIKCGYNLKWRRNSTKWTRGELH